MEIQVGQLAKAISERDASTLSSNTMKNPNEQIYVVLLVTGEEDLDNEEPITIEFDPSMKELQEEELDTEALMEDQLDPIYLKRSKLKILDPLKIHLK